MEHSNICLVDAINNPQVTDPKLEAKGNAVEIPTLPVEQTDTDTELQCLREKLKTLDFETKSAETNNIETAIENLKEEMLKQNPIKDHLNHAIREISRNWHSTDMETTAKFAELGSILQRFESIIDHETKLKYHLKDAIDEANRNWHSAELESSAKDNELGRVRERLEATIDREAKLEAEVQTPKQTNITLQNQLRQNYPILTKYHMREHRYTLDDLKSQADGKVYEMLFNEHAVDDDRKWLKALIGSRDKMINNLKIGNENIEKENKRLAESDDFLTDLKIRRFQTFIGEREEEKVEFEKEMEELAGQQA